METVSGETLALRRTMRDLIALSALPAVWAGHQPRQVAESLADALLSTLRLDLVYLRLRRETDGPETEICRTARPATTTEPLRDICTALAPWLEGSRTDSPPSIPNPVGDGTVHLLVAPLGLSRQHGVLVAGSQQTAFPSEEDRLLVTVGANQAAAVLQRLQAEAALRKSEERFRFLVQNSWDTISLLDAEGTILHQSPSVERLLGYRPQDRIGRNVFRNSIVHAEDRAAQQAFYDAIRSRPGAPVTAEFRLRHADGSWRDFDVVGQNFLADPSVAGIVVNYRDVTERKRAEEALRESHTLLSAVIEGTPDAVFVKDTRGRYILINTAGARLVGRRPEEVIGKDDTALFEPETARAFQEADRRVLEGSGVVTYEDTLTAGSVTRVFVTTKGIYRDARGRPLGIFGIARDITDPKRTEAALRESNHRLRIVTLATNDAVWDWDLETNKVWWNEGVLTLFGYRLENDEADREWWLERIHPDDRAAVEACFFEVVRGKELYWVDEYRFRCADGSYKDVYDRGYVLRDADGRATRMIGAILDITARKRAEEALRKSEHRWRSLAETLPQLVWTATPDGILDYASAQTVQYTGSPESELLGWGWLETLHPEDRERTRQAWQAAVEGQSEYEVQQRLRRSDGTYRWFKTRGVVVRDSEGNVYKWFGACTDITTDKHLEEALRQAKEVAEAANRAKDEFLANVSHEIRTPMNAILGMTELVLDTRLTDDQRQCLKTVKAAADNLLGMINDLLDFAKIEAGKLELAPAGFSLRATVHDTLRALATRAHKKGLELACNVQPDVPDALVGDAARLRQVMLNLVGNAIKFTEHGEVVVTVEREAQSAKREDLGTEPQPESAPRSALCALRFTVRDTGIGIPQDKHETIFRAFEQEDTSTTRKYGGTGLGLTIAARLAALMRGSITVQSEPGRGSTFAFTAQFERQPHAAEQTTAWLPVLLKGLRVLVVDDNPTNRQILQEWLRGWQMEPVAVGDGLAAMGALWDAVSIGRPYPLVLLDARMPDTDGLALAARIRERAALAAVRIILLTSDHHPGELTCSRELRIDALLLKPAQQDELLETIYRVMTRAQGDVPTAVEEPAREPSPIPAAVPLRILLAEDDEFSAQLMDMLLVRRGHRVRLASNGREALALAGQEAFDLMLLDVHMPELDGIEVVQGIREREQVAGGHLPVIALTARSRKEDRERCLAAGMDDFLTKPISAPDLLAAIDRLVLSHRVSRPAQTETGTHISLFDPGTVLAACDANAEALRAMCEALEIYLPVRVAEVADALRAQDAPRLREAAHKLSALLFAFSQTAGSAASDLEDQAAQGRLEEARPLVERLETMAQELLPQVRGLSLETLRRQAEIATEPADPRKRWA